MLIPLPGNDPGEDIGTDGGPRNVDEDIEGVAAEKAPGVQDR